MGLPGTASGAGSRLGLPQGCPRAPHLGFAMAAAAGCALGRAAEETATARMRAQSALVSCMVACRSWGFGNCMFVNCMVMHPLGDDRVVILVWLKIVVV